MRQQMHVKKNKPDGIKHNLEWDI